MHRVPYEIVVMEADRLIIKMATSTTWERADYYWDVYISYIEACGWTDQEFDQETIRRVDAAWRKNWN